MKLPWIDRLDARLGLTGKIALVLCGGGVLSVAVGTVAWLSFNQVVGLQNRILDDTVPTLELVAAVNQLNTSTLALVEQLRTARTAGEVEALEKQGQRQLAQVHDLLPQLARHTLAPALSAELSGTVDALRLNVSQQAALAWQALQRQAALDQALAARQQAVGELMTLAEALAANASAYTSSTVSSVYPMLERGASRQTVMATLDRLIDVDIDRMERMSELQLVCFRLKTTLDRLAGLRSPQAVQELARDFAADLSILSRRLEDFRDPTRKALAQRQRDMLAAATTADGPFTLQTERLALDDRLLAHNREGADLAKRLTRQGGELLQASREAVRQVGAGSREVVARGALGFLAVSALLVLGLLGMVWLLVRHGLLGRLKGLEAAMRALIAGRHDVAIPPGQAVGDPLAPLVQALEQFRAHAIARTQLEHSLRSHQQELEQQVADRTADLRESHALLEREVELHARARAQAEQANAAKNEFLGSLSHELRTPLSGVRGNVNLLRDTPLDDRQRGYVRMIDHANNTLLETLEDMLGFSRLEAGKLELRLEPFSPLDVVDDMLALQAVGARSKGLALVRDIAGDVPQRVLGDRRKLNQILLNTIGNATKFTDEGEVCVRVRCVAPTPPAAWRLRFEVSDTGIGIPAAQQGEVFRPFYQVTGNDRRRHGGTGLGLAICERLVALMGGELGLDSVEGQGTTVYFELPFDAAPVVSGAAEGAAPQPPAATGALEVLVVEDDEINRIVCQHYLEALGHRVHLADSGPAALAWLHGGGTPDCVLMDMSLPGKSGAEVTQEIRRLEGSGWHALPVIGMSAHASAQALRQAGEQQMAGFLSKPFQREELARALAQAVQGGTRHDPALAPPPADSAAATVGEPHAWLDEVHLAREAEDLGRDTLSDLAALLGRQVHATVSELNQALQAGDAASVGRAAHQLRSAAGNLGLRAVCEACREVEQQAAATTAQPDTGRDALDRAVQNLRARVEPSLEALQRWLASGADDDQ